jgi:hypothetical protein
VPAAVGMGDGGANAFEARFARGAQRQAPNAGPLWQGAPPGSIDRRVQFVLVPMYSWLRTASTPIQPVPNITAPSQTGYALPIGAPILTLRSVVAAPGEAPRLRVERRHR